MPKMEILVKPQSTRVSKHEEWPQSNLSSADLPGASPQAHELLAEASAAFLFRDFERSAARFKDGLVIVRQLDHKRAELRILYDLGVVYDAMEESDLAIAKFGQASKLAHEIRDEFAIESRLLARDAERVAKTSGPSKIIGVPEYEWELEMMCLRALVAVMKGAGRSAKPRFHCEITRIVAGITTRVIGNAPL